MLPLLVAVLLPTSTAATGSGSPLAIAVSCVHPASKAQGSKARGVLTGAFVVPATGLAKVTFSTVTCRTAVDTVLNCRWHSA